MAGVLNLDYTCDPAGNITAIADGLDPARSQTFAYDDLYRLVQAAGGYGEIRYTYDKTGNRLSKTENGLVDLYAYEPGTSRLSEITGATGQTFTYDAVGNTTAIDGRTFTYNQNNRLIRAAQDGAVLGEYVYNALGQRAVKTAGGRTTVFLYDLSGNLIAEADAAGRIQSEYAWLNGRLLAAVRNDIRVEADVEIETETLNLASQGRWITAFIELPEEYHAADIDSDSVMLNGLVPAEKSRIGDHDRDGVFDLMVKFDRRHTASLLDPGDAVEITVTGLVEGLRFGGVDTIRVIRRGNGKGKGAGKGRGRGGRGRPNFTDFGPGETTIGSVSVYFYHLNHLGTPRAMTDENGNVVWKADYKPFGEAEVAGDAENRFRFPGQYWDGETGLHYNWHRYYDSGIGRYVTADPIGLEGGINLFAYVNNGPINWIDPFALARWKGYLTVTAGGEVFGGGIVIGAFESDAHDGKKATVVVVGGMGGVTAGIPVSTTTGEITLMTPGAPDPNDFFGAISFVSANAGLTKTGGASYIEIGIAKSEGSFSFQYGFDASTSGYVGWAFVVADQLYEVSNEKRDACK